MKARQIKTKIFFMLLCILSISRPVFAENSSDYLSVTGPCNLEFPKDHGDHPGYRTEWWYYTGNLRSENGNQYGFQLTFFRSRISPPGAEKKWPRRPSAWRTPQVYLAHAAVSDIAGKQHLVAEDVSRAALGMAGVTQSAHHTKVFLKDWSIQIESDRHILKVVAADFSYELIFKPAKAVILHGDHGYSLKGSTPERASCYYSFSRLAGQGSMTIGDDTIAVSGSGWMDHEFSTALLEPGISGWDWFSLQLSNQTELMIFLLRTQDGQLHPATGGTLIHPDGQARHLAGRDFKVDVLDTWRSRQSQARYPARWRLQIASLALDLTVTSNLPDQEMRTIDSTGVTYWEGSVSLQGTQNKQPLNGEGYVELTGYAGAFDAPL